MFFTKKKREALKRSIMLEIMAEFRDVLKERGYVNETQVKIEINKAFDAYNDTYFDKRMLTCERDLEDHQRSTKSMFVTHKQIFDNAKNDVKELEKHFREKFIRSDERVKLLKQEFLTDTKESFTDVCEEIVDLRKESKALVVGFKLINKRLDVLESKKNSTANKKAVKKRGRPRKVKL